ncbi:hypothetical protein EV360DRAFT_90715, partial [Lentinula raphanica]
AEDGNNPQYNEKGQSGILGPYPEITAEVKKSLKKLRDSGAQISIITARGLMLSVILRRRPEILDKQFHDGSKFRASESFVRNWLHTQLNWSVQKATQAAHKLPMDWEDKCEQSAFRKAHRIKRFDIPAALHINSNQTQITFAPGDKTTWAETGSAQVSVLGAEENEHSHSWLV